MKRKVGTFATSGIDRVGESIHPNALNELANRYQGIVMPVWNNHDPSLPPVGRSLNYRIESLPNGDLALRGDIEEFEMSDSPESLEGFEGEYFIAHTENSPLVSINGLAPQTLHGIASALSDSEVEVQMARTKSIENLPWVTVYFGPIIALFLGEFIKEAAKDLYKAVKEKVINVLGHYPEGANVHICMDEDITPRPRVEIVCLNTSARTFEEQIDSIIAETGEQVKKRVPDFKVIPRRQVYSAGDDIQHLYDVDINGVPSIIIPSEGKFLSIAFGVEQAEEVQQSEG